MQLIVIVVMVNTAKKTTISLSESTKKHLAQFEKEKGETFDDILQRVMTNTSTLCNRQIEESDDDVEEEQEE